MKTILICCLFVSASFGQDSIRPAQPLHLLDYYIDSALVYSPAIKMQQTEIEQLELEASLLKYNWLRELYVTADVKYGRYGSANPVDQLNLGYGTGTYIRLPLAALAGQQSRKKIARLNCESSVLERDQIALELRQLVIQQYYRAQFQFEMIGIQQEAVDVAYINYEMANKDYINGTILLEAFARISEIYFTQKGLLEKAKSEYLTAKSVLEEICGLSTHTP